MNVRKDQVRKIERAREQVRDANDDRDAPRGARSKAAAVYKALMRTSTPEEWKAGHTRHLND